MDFTFDDDNNIVIASQSGVYTKCGGVEKGFKNRSFVL